MLVAYVSGHGYGHATRTGEVLRAVRERDAAVAITVVTSGPESLYRAAVPGPFEFRSLECDVGLAQPNALVIDERETVRRWQAFQAGSAERTAAEAEWLSAAGARLVLADIPPLAFAVANAAGVPAIGLANFSWDWIYRHLASRQEALGEAADHCAAAYRLAELLLQLPFAGDLSVFPRRERIPMVARRPRRTRAEARGLLALDDRPTVLVSFGGLGLPDVAPGALGRLARFRFLAAHEAALENVTTVKPADLASLGLGYPDLVAAADVVLSKPGYGIVSDCIAARTCLVYTDRGDFAEYPVLVGEMPAYLPTAYVSQEDLRAGHLESALEAVLAAPWPDAPDLGGAEVAAEHLLDRL